MASFTAAETTTAVSLSELLSVVVSPAHHLLAGGPEQDGVLELSRVAALGVAERRVRVHDAQVTQVLQGHQVLALAQAV